MNVLVIGANGYLGPHVVERLAPLHRLRITDIKPAPADVRKRFSDHEFMNLDVTSADQVMKACDGMDAVLNLSVLRQHRKIAFKVNSEGCYNVMHAAVKHKIRRVINTGPHFTITGPSYESFDHGITPNVPAHSGTNIYALSKSLGQEICRAFSERYDVYVLDFLFYNFRDVDKFKRGDGGVPYIVSWEDAAQAFERGLEVDLNTLPSRCEIFFIQGNNPQGKFLNEKTKRLLGYETQRDVTFLWRKRDERR